MLRRLHESEQGVGLVLALSVAFIIFSLGAVWIATTSHELDETLYHRHRSAALNSAEAGARWAMSALARDTEPAGWIGFDAGLGSTTDVSTTGIRTALETFDYVASGTSGGAIGDACVMSEHLLSATGEQTGEWWVRVLPIDLDEFIYQIEAWGWGPSVNHRQSAAQKILIQVRLVPEYDGFTNAIFAEGQLSGLNRKEIYGDVYAGETADITNYTRIYPNDAGHFGEGRLRIYGDLLISSGSNNEFGGPVHVQGIVSDDKVGTVFTDLFVRNDEDADISTDFGGQSWFREATVSGEAKFDKKWGGASPGYTGLILPATAIVDGVNDLAPVPEVGLPEFQFDPADYPEDKVYPAYLDAAAFEDWFDVNRKNLHGVHFVPEGVDLDFRSNTTLTDDFMVIADGSVLVQGSPSVDTTDTPANLIIVQIDESARLTTANSVISADGVLHHLLFSAGEYEAANQTTIYGSVYGKDDVSTNRLEVHYRAPKDSLVGGFNFTVPDAVFFLPEPQVWRAVPASEPTPLSDYCDIP